jgi:Tfp pilus assembly protein PilF
MADNPRIGELRRRFDKDPSSIAFAQLAEEYRRSGDCNQAVKICRDGLSRHPGYVSAQVTLGRALMGLGEYEEARTELESVLRVAPDNLTAIRALADIHQHLGDVIDPSRMDVETGPPAQLSTHVVLESKQPPTPSAPEDPALAELENWLEAIVASRSHIG